MRISIPEVSVGFEGESLIENVDLNAGSSRHEQYSIVPLIGMRVRGSIYHPNLLSFDWNGEGGVGRLYDSVNSAGDKSSRTERDKLWRYVGQANFLSGKPYNAAFVASHDHSYQNYDSFTTYVVDSTRYNSLLNWTAANLNLTADIGYREEDTTGLTDVTHIEESFLNFNGLYRRHYGQSSLFYRYDEFNNIINHGPEHSSVFNSVGASDSETFGSRRQITATTGGSYSLYEYSGQQTETIAANENITVNHAPRLDSFLTADFNDSTMETVDSSFLRGSTGVRHRLYESLSSTLDFHGSHDENSSSSGKSSNDRVGVGLSENYTKRLSKWGRLSLSGGIIADHENHESSGGFILTTLDESHQLYLTTNPSYRPAYLNHPRVLPSSIQVRGPGGIPAQENVDYQVIPSGQLTEIRLIQGSVVLRDGDVVLVNYQSASLYNASFESFNENLQVRVDLFDRVGVYVRMNWLNNNAPPNAVTETLTDMVGGVDYSWRWFRAGAEYEDYDSNFSQYKAWRFYQDFTFRPNDSSSLNLDFTQNFYDYPDDNTQTRYQFITRYNNQLAFSLAWYLEGGYSLQDVLGSEQNYGFARTGVTWTRGKLSIRAGYDYNYQTTKTGPSTEERDRHYFFVHLKRTF